MTDRFVSIVTGASRGIGAAVAEQLAAVGSRVALVGRDRDSLAAVSARCPESAEYCVDITSLSEVSNLVEDVESKLGPVDVLINNAGIGRYDAFLALEPEEWRETFDTNVLGAVNLIRSVLPTMIQRQSGRVINVASRQVLETPDSGSAYVASKAALTTLSAVLAKEVARSGVQMSVIFPGGVRTGFGNVPAEDKSANLLSPSDVARTIVHMSTAPKDVWIRDVVVVPMEG